MAGKTGNARKRAGAPTIVAGGAWWAHATWAGLSGGARALYLYATLAPENGWTGLFQLDAELVRDRMGWRRTTDVANALGELARWRIVTASPWAGGKSWVWVRSRWQQTGGLERWARSLEVRAAVARELDAVPAELRERWTAANMTATLEAPPAVARSTLPRRLSEGERTKWGTAWAEAVAELDAFHGGRLAERGPLALKAWTLAYPALDVARQLTAAHAWLVSQDGGRGPRVNVLRFLHNWMRRAASDAEKAKQPGGGADTRWAKLRACYESGEGANP